MRRSSAVLACVLLISGLSNASVPSKPYFSARRDYFDLRGTQVAAADLNGDGVPDLIATNPGFLQVLFGNGNGTFRQGPTTLTNIQGAFTIVTADINGDGKVDVIIAGGLNGGNTPQGIAVCLGNGDGTFQPGVFYAAGADTLIEHLVLGDFNGDGIPDVSIAGASGVWLFFGKGDGTYNSGVLAVSLPAGGGSLAAADLNGDQKLDLVVTMPYGPIGSNGAGFAVLLGKGDGTFYAPSNFTQPIKAPAVVVGDLDGDGKLDIALASSFSPYVYIYAGNGAGGFIGPTKLYLPGATSLALGDVNGDGNLDLVTPGVYIALGKGDGTFLKPIYHPVVTTLGTYNVALADLRNNGRTDIFMASLEAISVLLNQGAGKFEDGKWAAVQGGGGCGAVADYNRDGKPDLAINTPQGISILLGSGNAASPFTSSAFISLSGADCLVTGDVNRDGIPDLLVPTATAVLVYLGNGDGTFVEKSSIPTSEAGYLALGDFNHDGKVDFATSGNLMALGNGDGTFQRPVPIVSGPPTGGFSSVAAADLNGDGWSDLLLGSLNNVPLYVLINNQDGGFTQSQASFGQGALQILTPDLNQDGNADLVIATTNGGWAYLGNGHGEFTYAAEFVDPLNLDLSAVIAVADLNGDGMPDVSVLEGNTIAIFMGNGDGSFATPFEIGVGPSPADILPANLHGQVRSAGLPDLVAPDYSGGVTVLINNTNKVK